MCSAPSLKDLDLTDITTVAVDLETYDPSLKKHGSGAIRGEGFVCGIAIATNKQTLYFPIAHAMTDNLDPTTTWKYLNEKLFQNENIAKVFHNAMYDVCWIRAVTGMMPKGKLFDTMIAASVLDETRMRYSLDSISKDYLKESKYKYDLQEKSLAEFGIKDPMSNMHKLSYSLVKDYAEQDVNLTLKLWNIFEKKLNEVLYINTDTNENKTCKNIFELETKLFPCLVDMKFKGVRIDTQKAKKLGKLLEKRRDNLLKIIKARTSVDIEIWASASIKKLLDQQKITDYQTTPKSGMPQLPKNYLKTHSNRFLRMISKARECDKAKGAFVEGLLSYVHNGRIHADINQIRSDQGGTVTGRFSMSNPNLQQIPAKGFIGKKMRELFIPEQGQEWGSFDYSQQEPRIVVHYALKLGLPGTDSLEEEFNKEDADFHQIVADMAKIPRTTAKTINLGLFYGMGKLKLEKELNLSKKEANLLFNTYHKKVPFVKLLSQTLITFAEEHKLLYTLGDRFCRFNKWETRDRKWNDDIKRFEPVPILTEEEAKTAFKAELLEKYNGKVVDNYMKDFKYNYKPAFTYKALNRLIQGSAADMTKKAMVQLYERGILPQIQIHDELCLSVKGDKEKETIKNVMEKSLPLLIKNKVNCLTGSSWGDCKK
jgi:DNA polymerase I-like protein with 3'-5' exonuclease and polymerase domains|tara:strand:- start:8 stop:1969 length:1962 start_codon:yes stop_codon:yes gene_type:complete